MYLTIIRYHTVSSDGKIETSHFELVPDEDEKFLLILKELVARGISEAILMSVKCPEGTCDYEKHIVVFSGKVQKTAMQIALGRQWGKVLKYERIVSIQGYIRELEE